MHNYDKYYILFCKQGLINDEPIGNYLFVNSLSQPTVYNSENIPSSYPQTSLLLWDYLERLDGTLSTVTKGYEKITALMWTNKWKPNIKKYSLVLFYILNHVGTILSLR